MLGRFSARAALGCCAASGLAARAAVMAITRRTALLEFISPDPFSKWGIREQLHPQTSA
jgi:hypothetical protein